MFAAITIASNALNPSGFISKSDLQMQTEKLDTWMLTYNPTGARERRGPTPYPPG